MHVPATANRCPCPPLLRPVCFTAPERRTAPDPLSAPPTAPRPYAPPPVGEPTPVREDPPPDTQARVVRIDYFYLTPIGESLDVLA